MRKAPFSGACPHTNGRGIDTDAERIASDSNGMRPMRAGGEGVGRGIGAVVAAATNELVFVEVTLSRETTPILAGGQARALMKGPRKVTL
jgi:hypothetical protein